MQGTPLTHITPEQIVAAHDTYVEWDALDGSQARVLDGSVRWIAPAYDPLPLRQGYGERIGILVRDNGRVLIAVDPNLLAVPDWEHALKIELRQRDAQRLGRMLTELAGPVAEEEPQDLSGLFDLLGLDHCPIPDTQEDKA